MMAVDSRIPWVASGDWDRNTSDLNRDKKLNLLLRRFVDGVSWDETGIYPFTLRNLALRQRIARSNGATGSFDGCRSEADIYARYKRLDEIFETVRREGRLRTAWELDPVPLAQRGAIRVLLTRDGRFLFGRMGYHRLAIAKALRLPNVPVALTLAHGDAVRLGHLARHRAVRERTIRELNLRLPKEAMGVSRRQVALLASTDRKTIA